MGVLGAGGGLGAPLEEQKDVGMVMDPNTGKLVPTGAVQRDKSASHSMPPPPSRPTAAISR
jgi:hypothetical protein